MLSFDAGPRIHFIFSVSVVVAMVVAACKGEMVSSCQERLEAALVLPPASRSCSPSTACPHRDLTGEDAFSLQQNILPHAAMHRPHREGMETACVPTTCPCKPGKSLTSQPSPLCSHSSSQEGTVCRTGEDQRWVVSNFRSSD